MKTISVETDSQSEQAGILPGDDVISVNGFKVNDQIDFMFYGSEEELDIVLLRGNKELRFSLDGTYDTGMVFEPLDIRSCGNDCVFCFIDQNPPGMRKEIYVKDEDYRLSFLYGSYVTLANLDKSEIDRIIEQRLSPLYISIHAIDSNVRMKLLGISGDDGLNENIARLIDEGISMHCQIVVVPGINDGDVLKETVSGLYGMYPGVLSAAIVPVGLTKHRQGLYPISPLTKEQAAGIIEIAGSFQKKFRDETGEGFVYCADELFLRAGLDIPEDGYYDEFPQIENGVGMLRDFLDGTAKIKKRLAPGKVRKGRYVLVTGVSMAPYIVDFAKGLSGIPGISARALPVVNNFYGDTVTVSGLLTGGDIIAALGTVEPDETIVLPPNCLNTDGLFLDGLTPEDVSNVAGVDVVQAEYDPLAVFIEE